MHVHHAEQPQHASPDNQFHTPGHTLLKLLRLQMQCVENSSIEVDFVKPHNAYKQIER